MNHKSVQNKLDYYKNFSPSNYNQEERSFLDQFNRGKAYNPKFKYNEGKLRDYADILNLLNKEKSNDPVIKAFLNLYKNITKLLISIKKGINEETTAISGEIFGDSTKINLEKAINKYLEIDNLYKPDLSKYYTSKQLSNILLKELLSNKINDWTIEFSSNEGTEASIYELEKKIILKPNHKFNQMDVDRIICHEIKGHAFQGLNAQKCKKYRALFTAYIGTEMQYEGFAIFTEINLLSKNHILGIIKRYLLFMISIRLASEVDFYNTFKIIYKLTNDQSFAFLTTYRSKWCLLDTSKPGSFQMDSSYLLGALKIIDLVDQDKHFYQKLATGCFPFSIISTIETSESYRIPFKDFNLENINYFKTIIKPLFSDN